MLNKKNKTNREAAMSKLNNSGQNSERDRCELNTSHQSNDEHDSTRLQFAQLKRLRSIIENECFMLDIEPEFVSKGCEFAGFEFQQSFDFAKSVDTGIAVAKKCQHNVKFSTDLSLDTSLIIHKTPKKFKSV